MISYDSVLFQVIVNGIFFSLHLLQVVMCGFLITDPLNVGNATFGLAIALIIMHGLFALLCSFIFTINFIGMIKSHNIHYDAICCCDDDITEFVQIFLGIEAGLNVILCIASILIIATSQPLDFYALFVLILQIIYGGLPTLVCILSVSGFILFHCCRCIGSSCIDLFDKIDSIKPQKPIV
jgi:hypothetical protein